MQLPYPVGTVNPQRVSASTTAFLRDPQVRAYVLRLARGRCEACGTPAPFKTLLGMDYLEVHHIRILPTAAAIGCKTPLRYVRTVIEGFTMPQILPSGLFAFTSAFHGSFVSSPARRPLIRTRWFAPITSSVRLRRLTCHLPNRGAPRRNILPHSFSLRLHRADGSPTGRRKRCRLRRRQPSRSDMPRRFLPVSFVRLGTLLVSATAGAMTARMTTEIALPKRSGSYQVEIVSDGEQVLPRQRQLPSSPFRR